MEPKFFEHYPPQPGSVIEPGRVDDRPLRDKVFSVIGFGTMGRAHALNLRRGGHQVVVGSRPFSATGALALEKGLKVMPVDEAVAAGDVVMLMLPDEVMAAVYLDAVAPNLRSGAAVGFAHGFAIAFGQISPEPGRPCFLAAPKGQGDMLRRAHRNGGGVPGLLAVTDDSPPATWDLAAAYAKAVGCMVGGGFVTTFRQECISDQFGEQAVLCGGVIELLKAAFSILVESGYGEENAYFECVHELKLITDILHRHGIDGLRDKISGTAAYGGLTRGPRVIDDGVRANMKRILSEIESGAFAREFLARSGTVGQLANEEADGALARVGRRMQPRLHTESDDD